ncbi:MAG TPA: PKD domain-containing protein [Bacteroidia bacterium]|nr:PKD domain-containing protein [Bacteroidia bacterium]
MISSAVGNCGSTAKLKLQGNDFTVKDTSVCIDAPAFQLKALTQNTGKFSWKWEPAVKLDRYDIPNPTFSETNTIGTTTYTVTMIDEVLANCNQVKIVKVNVGSSFAVKTNDTTICEGEKVKIKATGADSYEWKDSTGVIGTTAEIEVSPATTTTYTVTGKSNTATCAGDNTSEPTVTVLLKPVVEVKDLTICYGDTITLQGSVTKGATTGKWKGGLGQFIPSRGNLTAKYIPTLAESNAGSVQLTLESEDPFGPCTYDSKTMTLTIVPKVTAGAGYDDTICETSTAKLAGIFGGAATGGKWSGGSGTFSNVNDPNATYTLGADDILKGKVALAFTAVNNANASCPGGQDSVTIFIDKKPIANPGANITICIGESAKLNGSVGGSAKTGVWSGGNGTFTPNNKTLNASYKPSADEEAAKSVVLTLTTDSSGLCPVDRKTMTIFINPVATIQAGPDQKACIGTPIQLAGVVGGGATTGVWSGGTGTYQPNNTTPTALYTPSPAEALAKKVVLTFTSEDPQGPCPAVSDEVTIIIDQLPNANITDIKPICAGSVINLTGSIKGAATTGTWSGGQGIFLKDNQDLTGTYKPTDAEIAAGKVTLILTTDKTGLCPPDTAKITVLIFPNPVVDFAVDTPKACPPHCVTFKDNTTITSTKIENWHWYFGKDSSREQHPTNICFPTAGFYDVTLKAVSDKGCPTTLTKQQYLETYRKPTAAFVANPFKVSQYDPTIRFYDRSTTDVVTWKWDLGDGKIVSPNTQNPVHQYQVGIPSTYIVKLFVVNAGGCTDDTWQEVEVLPEFAFYIPNAFTPNRVDGINDTFFGQGVGINEYHIWIFDRWGNCVFNAKDINAGWDGRANNGQDIAQQDVFVWKVRLTDIFGKRHDYMGTVTLVR